MYRPLFILAVGAALAIPATAHADTIDDFTITYLNYYGDGTNVTYTFSLPSTPTLDCAAAGGANCVSGQYFIVDNVPYFVSGDDEGGDGPGTSTETFFTENSDIGFSFDNNYGQIYAYPLPQQYFSGSVSDPTFIPGVYTFTYGDGMPDGTLAIVAETPEPSSFVLLGTGVLGILGAAKRKLRA